MLISQQHHIAQMPFCLQNEWKISPQKKGPLIYDVRENLLILVPLSQGHANIFNMAKQISIQNYLPKTKHVCTTEC